MHITLVVYLKIEFYVHGVEVCPYKLYLYWNNFTKTCNIRVTDVISLLLKLYAYNFNLRRTH